MRLESKKKVRVRGNVIGAEKVLVCLPLVGRDEGEVLAQAAAVMQKSPDLVEWRIDAFEPLTDLERCLALLERLRKAIGEVPLIFTCRSPEEGGRGDAGLEQRISLLKWAIDSGLADLVDIELASGPEAVKELRGHASDCGVKLIASFHDFSRTPSVRAMLAKMLTAQDLGADIAKVVVAPQDRADVLNVLKACLEARQSGLDIPLICMAMGQLGMITRMAGGLFGSDITFAVGHSSSAPGQVPVDRLRRAMEILY
jgi:3-dehydroquinate dehydratase-1